MHRGSSEVVLVLIIVYWLLSLRLVVASVEVTLFVVRMFLEAWMESPAVGGRIVVFVAVGAVGNVKPDMIWVGLGSGPNVGGFGFFLMFDLLFFLFCGHYSLVNVTAATATTPSAPVVPFRLFVWLNVVREISYLVPSPLKNLFTK